MAQQLWFKWLNTPSARLRGAFYLKSFTPGDGHTKAWQDLAGRLDEEGERCKARSRLIHCWLEGRRGAKMGDEDA